MCLVFNMNTFQAVNCATTIIFIILLTESCYSRNAENNVQLILNERKNVQFVKKLRQPDLTVQQNYKKLWDLDNPLDILEQKDVSNQQRSSSSAYFKIGGDNNNRDIIKNRVSRQINNGYSPIYPSLTPFNQNAHNIYSTPYKTPGPQYNGASVPPTNPYNYPSNVNSFNYLANHNQYPQNSTFQASVPSLNFSPKPSFYPYGQNLLPNNSTNPTYIQNNWYNQSSVKYPNRYNYYNNSYNYPGYSNTNNYNSGYRQPNHNQFYGLPGQTNNTNIYNTPNVYNFNTTRNNPVYNSARPMNGSFYPQPFRSSNLSTPYNPQNNYFAFNKNQFNNSIGGTTLSRPYQNNLLYLNQSSYTQTTPMSTPYFSPNSRSQNNFGGFNQSYRTEPNHFFYTPGGKNLNSTVNYNSPHKFYK